MSDFKFPDEVEDKTAAKGAPEEEFEVEVVDDTPLADRGRKPLDEEVADPTEDELKSYSEGVQSKIKKLTHARHDERRAKETLMREKDELEKFARNLLEENQKIKQFADRGSQTIVSQAKANAEAEIIGAREKLKAATEAFDTDAAMAAQEALMEAKLKLREVTNFRITPLQNEKDDVQPRQAAPQTAKPDEQSLRWQAKNQWFGADGFEEVTSFALGLHKKLVDSGTDPRSPEYFEKIDARMHKTFPELFGADSKMVNGGSKRPASVVAPMSRSTGPRKITLTASAMALAKKFKLTPQQYAAQVAKLESQDDR